MILVVVAGLTVAIERLIVTDAEALEQWAEDAGEAASDVDLERLRALMADEVTFQHRDLDATMEHLGGQLRKYAPRNVAVELRQIEVHGDVAHSDARISCVVVGRPVRLAAKLHFQRADGVWRLSKVENVTQAGLAR